MTPGSMPGTRYRHKGPERSGCSLQKSPAIFPLTAFMQKMQKKRGGGEITLVLEELAECLDGGVNVEEEYERKELEQCISRFVRALPMRERNVFVRRYFFTEPITAVAERYGLTENHIMVILSRTRKKLRLELMKERYL